MLCSKLTHYHVLTSAHEGMRNRKPNRRHFKTILWKAWHGFPGTQGHWNKTWTTSGKYKEKLHVERTARPLHKKAFIGSKPYLVGQSICGEWRWLWPLWDRPLGAPARKAKEAGDVVSKAGGWEWVIGLVHWESGKHQQGNCEVYQNEQSKQL